MTVTIISSGVDYIRLTSRTEAQRLQLLHAWNRNAEQLSAMGHAVKDAAFINYRGMQVASIKYGDGRQGACLQVSGPMAHRVFTELGQWAGGTPRIDLQATIDFGEDRENWHEACYDAVVRYQAATPAHKHPKPGKLGYLGEGGTFYLGKRSSMALGRVYDKGREKDSLQAIGQWRYEVEYHNALACKVAQGLLQSSRPGSFAASMVCNWFTSRGTPTPFVVTEEVCSPIVAEPPTDAARRLVWLETHVSGTVAWLARQGLLSEALVALTSKLPREPE